MVIQDAIFMNNITVQYVYILDTCRLDTQVYGMCAASDAVLSNCCRRCTKVFHTKNKDQPSRNRKKSSLRDNYKIRHSQRETRNNGVLALYIARRWTHSQSAISLPSTLAEADMRCMIRIRTLSLGKMHVRKRVGRCY